MHFDFNLIHKKYIRDNENDLVLLQYICKLNTIICMKRMCHFGNIKLCIYFPSTHKHVPIVAAAILHAWYILYKPLDSNTHCEPTQHTIYITMLLLLALPHVFIMILIKCLFIYTFMFVFMHISFCLQIHTNSHAGRSLLSKC